MTTDNQQPDTGSGKPAEITTTDFIVHLYAEKIARGECNVRFLGQLVRALSYRSLSQDEYMIWPVNDSEVAGFIDHDDTMQVEWLTVTPAAESPTAGEAVITWADLPEKEQIALQTWVNVDRVFVSEIEKNLQSKGLTRIVRIDHNRHQNMYTDLGRSVLRQSTDDSWKFRKVGAGAASLSLDYRETLSREGLLEYLKEREVQFEEVYQQEYDKRSELVAELGTLRSQLAAAHEATAEAVASRPTIVCLCGSTRFSAAFQHANLTETLAGRIVLTIGCDMKSDYEIFEGKTEAELTEIKTKLDKLHFAKIDLADEVLILNVGNYIGESTRRELAYTQEQGKRVRYLAPTDAANTDTGSE